MRISELSRKFLLWSSARGASPRTTESYEATYTRFVEFLHQRGEDDDLRHFTPEHVEAFIDTLVAGGLKPSSVTVKVSALSSLGTFGTRTKDAKGRYYLGENPVGRVYRPKRVRPAEKYLYAHEIKQLLAVQADAPSRLVLEILIDTALRASEVCRANVADLTEDGGRLRLAVVVKGGRPRTLTLGKRVGALLLESLRLREAKPGDPLIVGPHGGRFGRTSLSEFVLRLAVRAGVTRIAVRAHVLRHSLASLASAANVDIPTIAAMLNHSDLNTVTRYVHRQDAVDAAREKVRELLRGE
jgi:integrase/recombinase XerD